MSVKVGETIVRVDPRYYRPAEVETLLGDPSNANAKLGWVKLDGTPRKLLDCRRLKDLAWRATTPLNRGLASTYDDFKARLQS